MQWFKTLGDINWNCTRLTMQFQHQGKLVFLQDEKISENIMELEGKLKLAHCQAMLVALQGPICYNEISVEDHKLTQEQESKLHQLLETYQQLFNEPTMLPPKRQYDHKISLVSDKPFCLKPYMNPHAQKEEMERQVKALLNTGFIRESGSYYVSPLVLVKKKDGPWRFCTDFRKLNALPIKNRFPMPLTKDLLDELNGASYFSKLDLRSGYNQARMIEEEIHKTAFRTHSRHYEWVVLPFGLSNAPTTFQNLMNDIFREHLRKFILVFFDDILVYTKTWSEHIHCLHTTLQILQEHSLTLKLKNMQLWNDQNQLSRTFDFCQRCASISE